MNFIMRPLLLIQLILPIPINRLKMFFPHLVRPHPQYIHLLRLLQGDITHLSAVRLSDFSVGEMLLLLGHLYLLSML